MQPDADLGPATSAMAAAPGPASWPAGLSCRAVYVGRDGDLDVTLAAGARATFRGVRAGMTYPLRIAEIHAEGTTAGDLVLLW